METSIQLAMVGCNYRHSSLAVRERLAFSPRQAADALAAWHAGHVETEAVLVSTCNRVEFYIATNGADSTSGVETALAHLVDFHNVPIEDVRGDVMMLENADAARHLFSVAASLDSMVLGEAQVVGQVKQAYELADGLGCTGPLMHHLFQSALRVARRVASDTSLHRHRVSIPSMAIASFASRIFERFDDKRVLVIGAGKMAQETIQYLTSAGACQLIILNRDYDRARQLAELWRGQPAAWSALTDQLAKADVVVSTTGADRPVVSLDEYRRRVAPARSGRPLLVLDLAMPRDFDPLLRQEPGVHLYRIDDLSEACERNRADRGKELPAAGLIVEEETARFAAELRHRATGPVIARFLAGLEKSRKLELKRLFSRLPELDGRSRREIEQFADRLLGKMLHPPLASLRDESQNGPPHGLLDALQRLFQLKD